MSDDAKPALSDEEKAASKIEAASGNPDPAKAENIKEEKEAEKKDPISDGDKDKDAEASPAEAEATPAEAEATPAEAEAAPSEEAAPAESEATPAEAEAAPSEEAAKTEDTKDTENEPNKAANDSDKDKDKDKEAGKEADKDKEAGKETDTDANKDKDKETKVAGDTKELSDEEKAALKIEAVARGNRDRAKVKKMKEEKAAKEKEEAAIEKQPETEPIREPTPEPPPKPKPTSKPKPKQKTSSRRSPTRPSPKKSPVNTPSPRIKAQKNRAKQLVRDKKIAEQKEQEAKIYKERIDRETADLSSRYLKEITEGIIYVPTDVYPDINAAVARAKSSGGGIKTIHMAEGTFNMTKKHTAGFNYCVLDFPIQIIGEGADKTILTGMFELLSNGKCKADVHGSLIYEGSGIVFTNFSITNPTDKHAKATDQPTTRGIWSDRGLPLTMNYCEVKKCKGDAIYIRGGSYLRMNRCKIDQNNCQGVFMSGAGTKGCLVDLEASNNGDSALYVNRGADIDVRGFKTTIHHNGMYKEKRYGLKASGTDSEIRVHLPTKHAFLLDNGLHVQNTKDGEYVKSRQAKDKSEEFGGKITFQKLSKKQLKSYDNFLNRSKGGGNEDENEKRKKLYTQGFLTFPNDFSNIAEAMKFVKDSKGKIKEIKMSTGSHDFEGVDCHIDCPVIIRGLSKGSDDKVEIIGEFVIEGSVDSEQEIILDNLKIHATEGYSVISEGGMPLRMTNCEMPNTAETAVHISSGARIAMVNCHLHHIAHDGIFVEGDGTSARMTDCHIHHVDGGAAVFAGDGATITIEGENTKIHDNFSGMHAEDSGSKIEINMKYMDGTCKDNPSGSKEKNYIEKEGGKIIYLDKEEEGKRKEAML